MNRTHIWLCTYGNRLHRVNYRDMYTFYIYIYMPIFISIRIFCMYTHYAHKLNVFAYTHKYENAVLCSFTRMHTDINDVISLKKCWGLTIFLLGAKWTMYQFTNGTTSIQICNYVWMRIGFEHLVCMCVCVCVLQVIIKIQIRKSKMTYCASICASVQGRILWVGIHGGKALDMIHQMSSFHSFTHLSITIHI